MSRQLTDDEAGSILFITLALAILVLYLCLLVIDLRRAELAGNGVQRAADAAALAGLTELVASPDTDNEKWKNSIRAALAVLKQNSIFLSPQFPDASVSANRVGSTDACDTDISSSYRWQTFDNGTMRVEIARGTYDESTDTFTSLESTSTCNDAARPNSVQVTVTVRNMSAIFGNVPPFHFGPMPPITRLGRAAQL
ncbi:MAG: pilus assembly protein TadG-related protein [Bdellovibrionota bacterium]